MAKLETCDVYLPALGVCVGFLFDGRKWSLVGSVESTARARKPRNSEPIAAFARHRSRPRKRRALH